MNNTEFLRALAEGLAGLPLKDAEERLDFYSEMIADRMEEGLSEEEAVASVGSPDEIIAQLLAEVPLTKLVKNKMTEKKSWSAWEIVLLVLGSPVWLSILIAAAAVVFALYIALWAIVISLWAVFASLAGSALGCILGGLAFLVFGNSYAGIALIGCALIMAGLSVFLFFISKLASKATVRLAKIIILAIKKSLRRKERN